MLEMLAGTLSMPRIRIRHRQNAVRHFLLDRELQRENRRAREFGNELKLLAKTIIEVKDKMLSDGGEDNLPADIFHLSKNASEALSMIDGDKNRDRVHEMYLKIQSTSAEGE